MATGVGRVFSYLGSSLPIARVAAQVVPVTIGDRGQALELSLPVHAKLALENAPCRRTAQALMSFIDLHQQLDVRIASGK
jgi:hypothetical protein